jgi:hypothetical protein
MEREINHSGAIKKIGCIFFFCENCKKYVNFVWVFCAFSVCPYISCFLLLGLELYEKRWKEALVFPWRLLLFFHDLLRRYNCLTIRNHSSKKFFLCFPTFPQSDNDDKVEWNQIPTFSDAIYFRNQPESFSSSFKI